MIDSLVNATLVVDSVGFLVGKRVASVNPTTVEISGFSVELEIGCDVVVNNGNTLGINIHSGGYSVLTEWKMNKQNRHLFQLFNSSPHQFISLKG